MKATTPKRIAVPDRGRIFWDEVEAMDKIDGLVRKPSHLTQEPVFRPTRVWNLLGLSRRTLPDQETTLRRLGAWRVIRNLSGGRLAKVGSMNREDEDVWVLDNSPTDWVQSVRGQSVRSPNLPGGGSRRFFARRARGPR